MKEYYITKLLSKPYLSTICNKTYWCIDFLDNHNQKDTQIRRHSADILKIKVGFKLELYVTK